MRSRQLLFALPVLSASCSKKLSIVNEEMIVARRFIGFLYGRKRWGQTSRLPIDLRIQAIHDETQLLPMSSIPPSYVEHETMDTRTQTRCFEVGASLVDSLHIERGEPICEQTVYALSRRTLLDQSASLLNATAARRTSQWEARVHPCISCSVVSQFGAMHRRQ